MVKDNNQTLPGWPQAKNYKASIRREFSLFVSGIILLLMLITGYVISNQYVETVTSQLIDKLMVQARSYSSSSGKLILSTAGPDALLLNNICQKLSEENKDLYWSGITDPAGIFLAHTDIKKVISKNRYETKPQTKNQYQMEHSNVQLAGDSIIITVPIVENDVTLGNLIMASSNREIIAARNRSLTTVISITVVMLLIGIPLSIVVLNRKLKPLKYITNSLREMDYENIKLDLSVKSKNELGYLSETLKVMGSRLNIAQKEQLERQRINRELEIAREIQANILPKSYPSTENYEFSGTYQSAREVGGDYYDFIELGQNHLGVLIADVSGKSLPGMLVMLLTRDIIRNVSRHTKDPAHILSLTNEQLLPNIKKGMFVTMFFGVLNTLDGIFEFASAGHNPLILVDPDQGTTELINSKGFPLGLMQPIQFNQRVEKKYVTLKTGQWIMQYTDGINEAVNPDGEEYGMTRFVEEIKKHTHLNPEQLVAHTLTNHSTFVDTADQYDDITMLAMRWKKHVFKDRSMLKEGAHAN